jgi:hypothetical protein
MGSPVVQWQMLSNRPDELAAFYATLFGWTVNADNALGCRMVDTGSPKGIPGGIWPAPPEAHAFTQIFVAVDDVPASVARAQALGATVIVPPQKLPDGDELAILLDPQGISFGVTNAR